MNSKLYYSFDNHFILDEKRINLVIGKLEITTKKYFPDEIPKLSISCTFADGSSKDSMDKLSLLDEVNSKVNPISKISFSIITTNWSHIFLTLSKGGSSIYLDGPDDELMKDILSNLKDFLEEKVLVYRNNSTLVRKIVYIFWVLIIVLSAAGYFVERSRLVKLDIPMPITHEQAVQSTNISDKVEYLMWKNRPGIGISRIGVIYLSILVVSYGFTIFSPIYIDKIVEAFGNRSFFLIGDEIERHKIYEDKKNSLKTSIMIPFILGLIFLLLDRLLK